MHIVFARHGESTANTGRIIMNRGYSHGLTEKGRAQVHVLADRLEGSGASVLYTSPLKRAVESAQILGDRLDLSYTVASALREFDCGVLEGRSDKRAWEEHARIFREWYGEENEGYAPSGGENLFAIRERFRGFLGMIARNHPSDTVICVGHGGVYRAMIPYFFGLDSNLDNAEAIGIDSHPFV